jgi:hypothetical protein
MSRTSVHDSDEHAFVTSISIDFNS